MLQLLKTRHLGFARGRGRDAAGGQPPAPPSHRPDEPFLCGAEEMAFSSPRGCPCLRGERAGVRLPASPTDRDNQPWICLGRAGLGNCWCWERCPMSVHRWHLSLSTDLSLLQGFLLHLLPAIPSFSQGSQWVSLAQSSENLSERKKYVRHRHRVLQKIGITPNVVLSSRRAQPAQL